MRPRGRNRYRKSFEGGFTLVEMLVVIAIIGILATMVFYGVTEIRNRAYLARAQQELRSMETALQLYYAVHSEYPPDADRNIPPGLEVYLGNVPNASGWPDAPWRGSVYDWDYWDDPANPGKKIAQISIRFCPQGGPLSACNFPNESWAAGFQVNSSAYFCLEGACRAHINENVAYPGHCFNCSP